MTPQDLFVQEKIGNGSLPRVLTALGEGYGFWKNIIGESIFSTNGAITRKLLNDDGTDACLRDQSDETKNSIALLLGYK